MFAFSTVDDRLTPWRRATALATAAIVALALNVVVSTATAAPAAAASAQPCNFLENYYTGVNRVRIPAATDGVSTVPCYLRQGHTYPNYVGVKNLQRAWNLCYKPQYEPAIAEDGNFGANTFSAVRRIQIAEGIGVDGVMGTETKFSMRWPVVGYSSDVYQGYCWSVWA